MPAVPAVPAVPDPSRVASSEAGAAAVLGVDPGRHVGLAWVDAGGRLLHAVVTDLGALAHLEVAPGVVVVVGDGTGTRPARAVLARPGRIVVAIDEFATSEEGRRLYWRDHPPRGWRRWLPAGMRVAPRSLDDYAAYAIALRWLATTGRSDAEPRATDGPRERGRRS